MIARYPLLAAPLSLLIVACAVDIPGDPDEQDELTVPPPVVEESFGVADEGPDHHLSFRPDEIVWQPAPPSMQPGGEIAVLEGDPSEPAVFTMRIRMPDGYFIAPHTHPNVERVTVISGTFRIGSGAEMDPEAAHVLEPGSYTSIPPGTVHYAIAEGETIVQLTSVGPWAIDYVDPEDDPRLTD